MPTLSVSDKCTLAISKLNQVRSKYSTWYTGDFKDQPLVDCSDALEIKINQMKSKVENGVQKQVGGNGPSVVGKATACSYDSILGTKEGFSKWAKGVKTASDGDYVDHINSELSNAIANTLTLSALQTCICNLSTYTDSKLTQLDGLFGSLDSYLATIQKFMDMSALSSIALNCPPDLVTGPGHETFDFVDMYDAYAVYNPNAKKAFESLDEAKQIAGEDASLGEIKQITQERIIINGDLESSMSSAKNNMDTYTNNLS